MQIAYVYPNVSELNRNGRGSLLARSVLAEQTGCSLVEMPGDFIKNKTEVKLTGLDIGSFLDLNTIQSLYESPDEAHNIKYVLHTEPSLPRTDEYGLSHQAQLRWRDQNWVEKLIQMIIAISERLRYPAYAVEIHPGDRRNTYSDLLQACREILRRYKLAFGVMPQILLENRTGQFISSGKDIRGFWEAVTMESGGLSSFVGIVLDIQQLFTVTGIDFLSQISLIPVESIRGLHIHSKHRTPALQDRIPWRRVFDRIRLSDVPLIVNPEVHHRKDVPLALQFCRSLLE
jgi:sugar phosphate isomerase/epimerase